MQHKEWQDLIPFYVAQTLPADAIRRFEAHLADCDSCQREIDEWRMIASAVWREADSAARGLPPLSPEVYNRLNYRDRAPQSRYSANPPVQQQQATPENVRVLPQSRRRSLPLTMVAGTVVAVIFGGLLMLLALRQGQTPSEVALNLTQNSDVATDFADGIGAGNTETPVPGIIPTEITPSVTYTPGPPMFFTNTPIVSDTPTPTNTPVPPTTTDVPFVPPVTDDASSAGISAVVTEPPQPTITPSEPAVPLGGGPYITVTPGTYAEGLPLCEAFNPTVVPLEIFARADRNSQIIGTIQPGNVIPVRQVLYTGWYLVEMDNGTQGWLLFGFAYLRGNCAGELPIATVAASPTPVPGTPQTNIEQSTGDTVVVINASFADLYRGPDFNSDIVAVAERNDQFAVIGYQGTGTNRWVLVQLDDGSQVWIWASVVTEYPAGEAP